MATGYMGSGDMAKGLYQAPMGLSDLMEEDSAPIEIEVENPESVNIGLGDIEIQLKPERETAEDFDANLADFMSENDLQSLAGELLGQYEQGIFDLGGLAANAGLAPEQEEAMLQRYFGRLEGELMRRYRAMKRA